ncbi:uncharacterized protein NDAI_0G03460 [Naumovozyma dairenensis CBS 421]|uniref:Uncharacterized protein n=1 Tax=Naumovozyma dairenensis (strain ATCC 10597 / BCRC 20456 / CBS 421 / NBRC 0211 / NRRL Y-12639) TaxID=1071378 RepID=G0WEB2_NAUDC|nr:hypothetical protein NDAI_0G03460 [Naumovozyma dairenensis CBS 421]CCD26123.2 hypothetical protein NDAI_0G03460 [Naumovozyma dairenensis CBS 421]
MNTKLAFLLTALFSAYCVASFPVHNDYTHPHIVELTVIFEDIKTHLNDYIPLCFLPGTGFSLFNIQKGILDITIALSILTESAISAVCRDIDYALIHACIIKLPWYAHRLEPAINAALQG